MITRCPALLLPLLLGACTQAVMVAAPVPRAPAAAVTSAATAAARVPGAVVRAVRPPRAGTAEAAPAAAMVSAADSRAAEAGLAMLRQGGSAADAAAATMLALTVVEPQSSGIGGGGFIVYRDARGRLTTLDGRETAPAAATSRQFLKADGTPKSSADAATGGLSVGVPGNVRLIAEAHRRWGTLPWAALFAPAIALAEGYTVTPRQARFIGYGRDGLAAQPAAASLYLTAAGQPKPAGSTIVNPALAQTLRTLAAQGPDAFYAGPIAAGIVAAVTTAPQNPGGMAAADLAAYRVHERAPVCGRYRAYRVCGMGPPSAGGVAVLQILQQLERFDMPRMGPGDPVAWHLFGESQRLAYADLFKWQGDPGFVSVPAAGMLAPAYIAARSALISPAARIAAAAAGDPPGAPPRVPANDNDVPGTTHFAAADARGAIISYTATVERPFGSGLVSGGFVLNNELTDFNFNPASGGALTANRLQPGKRPRSAMSPTIVMNARGEVVLAIGAAGGLTIIAQVAKAIIGVVDWGQPVQAAIALPQLIAIGDRFQIEQGTALEAMRPAFEALGHTVTAPYNPFLKANGIERVPGGWRGGADPRTDGVSMGM